MRVVSTAMYGYRVQATVQLCLDSTGVIMNLQEYVKFLFCVFVVALAVTTARPDGPRIENSKDVEKVRVTRGVLDFIFGGLKSCGGCQCGRPNRGGARILGGEYTDTHEFPWLANVHVKSKLVVSGVLINDRYVMTAASQLIAATAPEIKVSLGEYDRCHLDISSSNVSVETVIPFPEFNPESRSHDLALLRLSQPTKFERRISPVCMPNPGSTYLGQVGTLSGWIEGKAVDASETRTCRPRKLGLPVLGYSECIKSGVSLASFHDDSGCIGVIGGNSLVCENDVGSSVLYRSYADVYDLVGIMSDVNKCDDKPAGAVFTRIGPHLDWILQQTKDACYCTK
ncbi:vitamin K-dependent protein C-like [Neodiprion fabricii]|uniref:vitamin K-dependent protein C-like n=1 Tax=Neodiprion fabricii TaxID=2872261 RepID=UPI001ED8EF9C|nr:vitamin K-dependent protein C-like [Neodiprion fabricii]